MMTIGADGADPEQRGVIRGLEAGCQDDGAPDYFYEGGAVPTADGGAKDARQVGPHHEPDWDVQVCCEAGVLAGMLTGGAALRG